MGLWAVGFLWMVGGQDHQCCLCSAGVDGISPMGFIRACPAYFIQWLFKKNMYINSKFGSIIFEPSENYDTNFPSNIYSSNNFHESLSDAHSVLYTLNLDTPDLEKL